MKPGLPKGTRDFLPEQMVRREYIFNTIRKVFRNYGYAPIETPAMERLDTLTGKYGEEGDQLLFKVLNNGDFLRKADEQAFDNKDSQGLIPSISKRGLRYDLTVPFARFVVMNQNELSFPFKRYQIQPVWRADRPQKGRYQEFYQCDADVVGSDSLMYEAEFLHIYDSVFTQFNLPVEIRVNNRKILAGMAETIGAKDQFLEITIAIDKWDKIGAEGVKGQLEQFGLSGAQIVQLIDLLKTQDLDRLSAKMKSKTGQKGIAELSKVFAMADLDQIQNEVRFVPMLARGLNYYTGCIFEVAAKGVEMGSIGGGGRYADLTAVFGMKDMPGVGISFGAERIYDVMEELDLFPEQLSAAVELLFVVFDEQSHRKAIEYARSLRGKGVRLDVYPEPAKMKKQMKYADQRNIPYVALIGSEELEQGALTLKHMKSGEQKRVDFRAFREQLQESDYPLRQWFERTSKDDEN
jgi:histidyl-tRNA synthetase